METLQAILTRRSIRKFKSLKVHDDVVKEILKAAMYAPSASNTQSWHFIVITERDLLNKIPKIHPYAEMMYESPLAILICGDLQRETITGYNVVNCSAATQNLLLAAHDMGLGAVWLGLYPRVERVEPFFKLFELPEHIIPISMVVLGYPNEQPEQPDRFKPDRIHYNKW